MRKVILKTMIEEGLATRGTMVRLGLSIYILSIDLTLENYGNVFQHPYPWSNMNYPIDNSNLYYLPDLATVELI